MCDVFEHVEAIDEESFLVFNHWYSGITQQAFVEQYQRFHVELPDMIVEPSSTIDATRLVRTCRLVHVDGGHKYEIVRQDAATARSSCVPAGSSRSATSRPRTTRGPRWPSGSSCSVGRSARSF